MDTLSGVMKLKDKITPSLRKVSKAIDSLQSKVVKAQKIIDSKTASSHSKISSKINAVNSKINNAIDKSQRVSSRNTTKRTKKTIKDFDAVTRAISRQTKAMENQMRTMNKMTRKQMALAARERAALQRERQRSQFKKHSIGFSHSIKNLAVGGLPLSYALYASGKEYAKFEHQMQKVFAKTDPRFLNQTMKDSYIAKAQHLGRTTQFTQSDVAKGMEQLTIAGLQGSDLLKTIDPAVFLAGANPDLGMEGSTRFMATIAKAFSDQVDLSNPKQMMEIADTLSYLSTRFQGTAVDFEEAFKYTISSARDMGMSWKDTLLNTAALHEVGSVQSMAGTSFNQMLMKLAAPTQKGKDAMNALGLDIYDKEGQTKHIFEIFKDFRKKTLGLNDRSRNALFKDIFGVRGSRGAQATIKALDDLFEKVEQTSRGLASGKLQQGFAERMTKEQLDSIIGQLTLAHSTINDIQTTVFKLIFTDFGGSPALDGFKQLVEYGQAFAGVLAGISKAANLGLDTLAGAAFATAEIMRNTGISEETITNIAAAALGFYDGLKLAYDIAKKMVTTFMELVGIDGFDSIRQNVKVITALMVGFAAFAPIVLALGVGLFAITNIVGTIVGAFGMLKTAGLAVFGWLSKLPNLFLWIGGAAKWVFGFITTFFSNIIGFIMNPVLALKGIGSAIAGFFSSTFFTTILPLVVGAIALLDLFRGEGESMGDAFMNLLGAIGAVFNFLWENALKPLLSALWDSLKPAVEELLIQWNILKESIRNMFTGDHSGGLKAFGDAMFATFKFLGSLVGEIIGFIIKAIANLMHNIRRVIKIITGIFSGEISIIDGIVAGLFTVIGGAVENILAAVESLVRLANENWADKILQVRMDLKDTIDRKVGFSEDEIQKRREMQERAKTDSQVDEFGRMVKDSTNLLDGKEGLMGIFEKMSGTLDSIAGNTEETAKNGKKKTSVNIDGRSADKRQANRQDVLRERAGSLKSALAKRLSSQQGYQRP